MVYRRPSTEKNLIMKIKIFLADDHPVVRDGLKTILETQKDFEVVGEASNGKEAIRQLADLEVDILFVDLEMPEMDGLELIQQLQKNNKLVNTIVFTVFDTDERILSAIKAGAKGYLLKGASRQELFQAVRVVYAGGSLLQPLVASKLFRQISNNIERPSPRELEVLQLLAKGLTNKAIAQSLFITERTVKFHVSSILSKLDANNRTEAVKIALEKGFI